MSPWALWAPQIALDWGWEGTGEDESLENEGQARGIVLKLLASASGPEVGRAQGGCEGTLGANDGHSSLFKFFCGTLDNAQGSLGL